MDVLDHHKEHGTVAMDTDHGGVSLGAEKLRNTGNPEQKRAAVHAELQRVNQLPSNSNYAVHRLKVLNKVLHLMSIKAEIAIAIFFPMMPSLGAQYSSSCFMVSHSCHCFMVSTLVNYVHLYDRTISQDEELELLFAGLSI